MSATMDAPTAETVPHPAAAAADSRSLPSRKLAVWLFLGSEVLFFSALIFTYIVVRLSSPLPPAENAWPMPLEIQGGGPLGIDATDSTSLPPSFVEEHQVWTVDTSADHHDEEAYLVSPDEFAEAQADGRPLDVPRILNIPLTALNTFLLILSSLAVVLALDAVQKGKQKRLVQWLGATLALGIVFLGIQAWEYFILFEEGLWFDSIPIWLENADRNLLFGTTFFTMTGFHGLHVFGGVVTLLIILVKAIRGHYTPENHEGVELFGLYWHFVDLVWIILFTVVYLI